MKRIIFLSDGKASSLKDIKNFSSNTSFFICEELERRGIEVTREDIAKWPTLNSKQVINRIKALPKADAILSCKPLSSSRKFGKLYANDKFMKPLLNKVRSKKIYTVNGSTRKSKKYEHAFAMLETYGDTKISWAADPKRCMPNQPTDRISILLDHISNKENYKIYERYFKALEKVASKGITLELKILEDPTVHDVNNYRKPKRISGPWDEVYLPYYRRAHLFCPTHKETLGLSVIESSMCGAQLFLANKSYINPELLKGLQHFAAHRFDSLESAFIHAIENIDVAKIRQGVIHLNWQNIVEVILTTITEHLNLPKLKENK